MTEPLRVDMYHGDCLEVMPTLAPGSVAMVFADLPYGYGVNKWDIKFPLMQYLSLSRLAIAANARQIFTCDFRLAHELYAAMPQSFRYDLVWQKKGRPSGHLNAKRCPLRCHETILVFGQGKGIYNAQMTEGRPHLRSNYVSNNANGENFGEYVQQVAPNNGTRYPQSILSINRVTGAQDHPTQKPIALLTWLISTYTNPGDTVLDPVAGSGTTAIAALRTGRNAICIEKDPVYFAAMQKRVADERARLKAL